MKHSTKAWLSTLVAVGWLGLAGPTSAADGYPDKTIKLEVGFSAGSGTDTVARVVAKAMSERLGQSIIVENRAGAGGTIASDLVAKSKPDGYTLLLASSSISISPAMFKSLPFDTERDLMPIGFIGALPTVLLVNTKTVPAKSLAEFLAFAKSKPDVLKFGSSGVGGSTHLFAELFKHMTGVKLRHIPYRGGSQDTMALRTGEVDVLFETLILALPLVPQPDILALAVTGPQRSASLANVPTFTEAGMPAFAAEAYFGILGPANLPPAVVDKLNAALNDSLKDPDVVSHLAKGGGLRLTGGDPKAYAERIHGDIAQWKQVVKDAGIQAE
jgi:tripartite-type tricarboxylate transporter receptor subunit TctC